MNLSFAGCGFLGIYHVGVAACFRKFAPHLLNKISGASFGALAACSILCDLSVGDLTSDVLRVATEARSRRLGPFNPNFNIQNILREGLEKALPKDAHITVNGKLHVSLTRMRDGQNVIVSEFDSREDLINVLLASSFIPLFSGVMPPKYRGVRYMDGGFSDNLPTLDENTITVSPFCGESDICPRDDSSQLFHINVANTSIELSRHNIYRIARILFPPRPEILSNMCKQGFDDALRFMQRNNLISCTRCLSVQSTFVLHDKEKFCDDNEYDPQCTECTMHRQEACGSNMPDTVLSIFQEAIDSANQGLYNWIFKNPGMKILSVLTLPYMLPADMIYATITKLLAVTPHMSSTLWEASKFVITQASKLYYAIYPQQAHESKVFCHMSVSEYGNLFADEPRDEKTNLNFSMKLNNIDNTTPLEDKKRFTAGKVLSRHPSLTLCTNRHGEVPGHEHVDDTFEHILNITTHHDAIMAYYYLDENNKVKVTEIFDVTEDDSPALQTSQEKEVNGQLEYDDDWNGSTWLSNDQSSSDDRRSSIDQLSEYSFDEMGDRDNANLFSDPESEWTGSIRVEEPEDDQVLSIPESEQTPNKPSRVYEQLQF